MLILCLTMLFACGDDDSTDSGHGHHTNTGSTTDTGNLDYATTQATDGGTYTVSWTPTPTPAVSETFVVDLDVTADVMPEGGFTVSDASAMMPNHGHGMNVDPVVTDNGDGTFSAAPFEFQMPGWWQISIDVTSSEGTETAVFNHYCCD